jgi:hypothetical protein
MEFVVPENIPPSSASAPFLTSPFLVPWTPSFVERK